jgi:hypothetical protein
MKVNMTLQKRGFIALVQLLVALTVTIVADRNVYGQRIEVFGGGNKHNLRVGGGLDSYTDYQTRPGYTVGAGIANLRVARIPLRATLQVETNHSKLYQRSGGMGGGYSIEAESNRTLIALGIYPLNFRIARSLLIHIGMEVSYVVADNTSVVQRSYIWSGTPPPSTRYNEVDVVRNFGYGVVTEAAWHFMLKEHYFAAPWCRVMIGLSDPFENSIYTTRICKFHGGVSVIRRLGFD